ncbi:MAG TPA: LysM peptidoglycan-binding domain-containing protein, partial [Methylomirabilota bacterium]|nr:LysM peptidoglycan-binding domain-containing protein [Methylomirabilota bacterium]
MRYPAKFDKARLFGQVAAVALIAGLSAGCSADVDRFGNLFQATDNRAQIVPSDTVVTGSVAPAPTTSVTSGALPPPTQPVLQTAAPGTGWSATGGTRITVGTGESLQVLSTRYGVPVAAIASANNIPPNALLAPGQSLLIPSYASAPAEAAPTQTAVASTGGGAGEIYVVKPGDSLGRIANDRGFKSIAVATFNGIDPSAPIKVGQKLKIPPSAGAARTQVAA